MPWLNGVGVMVWEVVFGVWVGWNDRYAATLRRMLTAQRAATELLVDGEWTPLAELTPEAHAAGVYASRFERDGVALWALANRGTTDYRGKVLLDDDTHVLVPARGIEAVITVAHGAEEPGWLPRLREYGSTTRPPRGSTGTSKHWPHRRLRAASRCPRWRLTPT